MAIVTSQQLNQYFEKYKNTDVTFNKEVIKSFGLLPKSVFIKHRTGHIPCVIYSSSMTSAKVLANLDEKSIQEINEQGNNVSLRYSFVNRDKNDPMNFFVPGRVLGINKYKDNPNLFFLNIQFTQRPPNDLVLILGTTLDAVSSASQRKEERIQINAENQRILNLSSKNTTIFIEQIPRNAILRDLSFSGAKVIVLGNAKFLVNKHFQLNIPIKEDDSITIPGQILRHEDVEGRQDICALALLFEADNVPIKYKIQLNNYFQNLKRK
ncbi:MAG: PilZ domain-containing protein [Spirochaetaceae bacterium]|jgi:hypothetical protein|nr:PilZ domain-containing protein [Spirochaetaceae bacterium]